MLKIANTLGIVPNILIIIIFILLINYKKATTTNKIFLIHGPYGRTDVRTRTTYKNFLYAKSPVLLIYVVKLLSNYNTQLETTI